MKKMENRRSITGGSFKQDGISARGFLDTSGHDRGVVIVILVSFVFILLCFCPSLTLGETQDSVSVTVLPFSRVSGKELAVRDLAEIKGPEALRQRIGDLKIGTSPMPGKQKRIPGSMVESKIRSLFPNRNNQLSLSIPGIIVVERAGQEVTESELQALFYAHVEKRVEGRPFRLKDVKIRGNRILPFGQKTLTVDDRQNLKYKGRVAVTVRPEVEHEKTSPIYISGWVDLFDEVVCAERDIPRGEKIKREDLRLSRQNLSKSPPGLMTRPEKVEGTVAKSRIEKGSYIRDAMIAQAPVVRKGDVVKITANSGGLTVVAQGVAREDGRMGEKVMVENIRSNKNIPARVVGPGAVEVVF